jgi:hypothetical protein
MTTPFGPQLIGETEKTLNALLIRYLDGSELTEPQWVTMRIASMLDGPVSTDGLAAAVADRAHFTDAARLVDDLTTRGLLDDGRLSASGTELIAQLQGSLADDVTAIFGDLPADDIAAAERILNELVDRARCALARAS